MKSILLFLPFLLLVQLLSAQTFTEFPQTFFVPFRGVESGSIAFADVDGDNDQDVLITGQNNANTPSSKLYLNDGTSNFTEVIGTPFEGVSESSIAFSDVDGDNDQDVLITGQNNANTPSSKLYLNDGTGNFTEVVGTPFEGVFYSSIAFSDVDGDNDQDVLITGQNNSTTSISKLYTNDGAGNFIEVVGTPFEGVSGSSIAFSNVDGDNDQDVLITGYNNSGDSSSKLYLNDGAGNFTEVMGTPFEGVYVSSIAFSDVDGDNYQDVLITGYNNSYYPSSKLYLNDGAGNFTEVMGTPFIGVYASSIAFSDVDGDNDQDVLITGRVDAGDPSSKLYLNDGTGIFTEVMDTPFEDVDGSSIAFSDVDGDNDQDVLITGGNDDNALLSQLYLNDGGGTFTKVVDIPFEGVFRSSIAFSDVDGDNDQDVLITGRNDATTPISQLYLNDGTGNFTEVMGTPFDGVTSSSIAFSDVDGDNDQDVLITGYGVNATISKLYLNDGTGIFTEVVGTPFDGVFDSSIAFSDVDGDNDQDVLITGYNINSNSPSSKLYLNDGTGIFIEVVSTPFEDVFRGSIAFFDVDGDNDQDVLITGWKNPNTPISKLYLNDGVGNFTEVVGTPFEGILDSSIAFSDVDGDGDHDLLITGVKDFFVNETIAKLYLNDGVGNFTEVVGTPFEGVTNSSIAFSDVDGDNDQDVLITGQNDSTNSISKLYLNDGTGIFTEVVGTPFEGVSRSFIAFSDVDGDTDQDVLITGFNNSGLPTSKLYLNESVPTSIDDRASVEIFEFSLYPNPTHSNQVNLRYESLSHGMAHVQLYDLSGRLLFQQHIPATSGPQTLRIDLGTVSKGTYLLRLTDGQRSGSRRIVVMK